jgi:predicted Rossmann fold flavoprotein
MGENRRIVVAGGGAAGFFGAIACAEANPWAEVTLHEATAHPLAKVRVSGGGRCNVTHACFDAREMAACFPRGSRELIGPFSRFGPADTVAWFKERGVELKTEKDGRMFPVTDDSATIVECLMDVAAGVGARLFTGSGLRALTRVGSGPGPRLAAVLTTGETILADRVLIATGGTKGSAGLPIAASLGHTIIPAVPSLFTFHIDDARLKGLEGVAAQATASVRGTRLSEVGPVLVTHWGLSGPAILRLSAWGARELHDVGSVLRSPSTGRMPGRPNRQNHSWRTKGRPIRSAASRPRTRLGSLRVSGSALSPRHQSRRTGLGLASRTTRCAPSRFRLRPLNSRSPGRA